MKEKIAVIIITCSMFMAFVSCGISGNRGDSIKLSEYVIGQWEGQFDVSQMLYEELSEELGFDVSLEPVYSEMYITFHEDGTCLLEVNVNAFAEAVGKCVEPYVSGIFGFDTDALVNLIMQQAVSEMGSDDAMESGIYEVNDELGEITIENEDGTATLLTINEDFSLELVEEELGQTIIFNKLN